MSFHPVHNPCPPMSRLATPSPRLPAAIAVLDKAFWWNRCPQGVGLLDFFGKGQARSGQP